MLLNIHEIKAKFSYFADQVRKGKTFIIAHRNVPFAELRPIARIGKEEKKSKVVFGVLKDAFELPDDFNSSIPDFEKEYYGE